MNNRLVDTHPHFASIFQSAIVQYSCQYLLRAIFKRFASVLLIGPGPDHQIIRTCKNRVRDSSPVPVRDNLACRDIQKREDFLHLQGDLFHWPFLKA